MKNSAIELPTGQLLCYVKSSSSVSAMLLLLLAKRSYASTILAVVLALCCGIAGNVVEAIWTLKHGPTSIGNTEQYLATAAATNKLGECLPSSTDDDATFTCFAKLRSIATATGIQNKTLRTRADSRVDDTTVTIPYVHHEDCYDDEVDSCPDWAASGECNINPAYMLTHCRYSCQTCYDIVDGHGGIVQVAPGSSELRQRIVQHITETAQYIRNIRKQYPQVRSTCRNWEADCTYKAVLGQCLFGSDTATYMHQHCPAACRTCI